MAVWTFDKLVDAVVDQFDVSTTRGQDAVNQAHQRMVVDSRWRMAKKSLGSTVAGTSNYALPDECTDLAIVRIDYSDGPVLYTAIGLEQMWNFDTQSATLIGPGGLFAPDFDSAGVAQIRLYPAPDVSGLAITALEAIPPADTTYGGTDNLIVPSDLRHFLKDGAFAELYAETDEDQAKSDFHEARFQRGTELLRRRKNSRMDGSAQTLTVSRRPFPPGR